jgi:hypothetical protein
MHLSNGDDYLSRYVLPTILARSLASFLLPVHVQFCSRDICCLVIHLSVSFEINDKC